MDLLGRFSDKRCLGLGGVYNNFEGPFIFFAAGADFFIAVITAYRAALFIHEIAHFNATQSKIKLSRVKENILNFKKFKEDNSYSYPRILVKMIKSEVEISVADDGIGISRADQDRLFEKFYRVYGQQDTDSVGSGLGLSFVKSIAERHGVDHM